MKGKGILCLSILFGASMAVGMASPRLAKAEACGRCGESLTGSLCDEDCGLHTHCKITTKRTKRGKVGGKIGIDAKGPSAGVDGELEGEVEASCSPEDGCDSGDNRGGRFQTFQTSRGFF